MNVINNKTITNGSRFGNRELVQKIGADVARGYTKGFSIFGGSLLSCLFKSNVGPGRDMDFGEYEESDQLYMSINGDPVGQFVGVLSEKESDIPNQNSVDDKTNSNPDFETLLCTLLYKIAVTEEVDIILGVPKKLATAKVREKVKESYEGRTYNIKNLISNEEKVVTIRNIDIAREGDACAYGVIKERPELRLKPFVCAVLGFRTLEMCYYDVGMKYNDKKSKWFELGNITTLQFVQSHLATQTSTFLDLEEIDSRDDLDKWKRIGERATLQKFKKYLENALINMSEQDLFVAGGTAINLSKHPGFTYHLLPDAQMAVAKGLFEIAKVKYING